MNKEIRGYGNPKLDEIFAKRAKKQHLNRVRSTRRVGDKQFLDTVKERSPVVLSNAKQKQLEDDRIREIEFANRKLFKRIRDIEVKATPRHLEPLQPGSEVDKPSNHLVNRIMQKRQQMETIHTENMRMLKRLQQTSPTISYEKWVEQRSSQERKLADLCRYPHIFKADTKSTSQMREQQIETAVDAQDKLRVKHSYLDAHKTQSSRYINNTSPANSTQLDLLNKKQYSRLTSDSKNKSIDTLFTQNNLAANLSKSRHQMHHKSTQREMLRNLYQSVDFASLQDVTLDELERMDEEEARFLMRQRMLQTNYNNQLPKIRSNVVPGRNNSHVSKSLDITAIMKKNESANQQAPESIGLKKTLMQNQNNSTSSANSGSRGGNNFNEVMKNEHSLNSSRGSANHEPVDHNQINKPIYQMPAEDDDEVNFQDTMGDKSMIASGQETINQNSIQYESQQQQNYNQIQGGQAPQPIEEMSQEDNFPEQMSEMSQPVVSQFCDDPRVLKMLTNAMPCDVSGKVLLPPDRETLWKNLCMIGANHTECVVEFSRQPRHFYIMAWDIMRNQYHVISLHRQQANKLLKVCESDLERIMKMLDFKHGKMIIRHFEILMSFERFMPQRAKQINQRFDLMRGKRASEYASAGEATTRQKFLPLNNSNNQQKDLSVKRSPRMTLPRDQAVPRFSLCSKMKETKLKTFIQHFEIAHDLSTSDAMPGASFGVLQDTLHERSQQQIGQNPNLKNQQQHGKTQALNEESQNYQEGSRKQSKLVIGPGTQQVDDNDDLYEDDPDFQPENTQTNLTKSRNSQGQTSPLANNNNNNNQSPNIIQQSQQDNRRQSQVSINSKAVRIDDQTESIQNNGDYQLPNSLPNSRKKSSKSQKKQQNNNSIIEGGGGQQNGYNLPEDSSSMAGATFQSGFLNDKEKVSAYNKTQPQFNENNIQEEQELNNQVIEVQSQQNNNKKAAGQVPTSVNNNSRSQKAPDVQSSDVYTEIVSENQK